MSIAPMVVKAFNLFVDGKGYAGACDDVRLPKLTKKTEEYRAAGMDAPVAIDMGMEKLDIEFTLSAYDNLVLSLFGVAIGNAIQCTLRAALEDSDGKVTAVVHNFSGSIREIDPGTLKAGDKPSLKVTMDLNYYSCTYDGVPAVVIDVANNIRTVGGIDRLASVRLALGM